MLLSDCKENYGTICFPGLTRAPSTCWTPQTVTPTSWKRWLLVTSLGCTGTTLKPICSVVFLIWQSDKSTKDYLTQILLANNWPYWQAGKNSRMHMKVQGHLMQARFQPARLILFRNHCCYAYMYTLQAPAQNCILIALTASVQAVGRASYLTLG